MVWFESFPGFPGGEVVTSLLKITPGALPGDTYMRYHQTLLKVFLNSNV